MMAAANPIPTSPAAKPSARMTSRQGVSARVPPQDVGDVHEDQECEQHSRTWQPIASVTAKAQEQRGREQDQQAMNESQRRQAGTKGGRQLFESMSLVPGPIAVKLRPAGVVCT